MTAMIEAMDNRVLVLNKHWMAVDIHKTWKAVQKVVAGRALFVDPVSHVTFEWEDWVLNWDDASLMAKREAGMVMGVGNIFEMVVPEIIVCTEYDGRGYKMSTRKPKFSRTNVYRRDRYRCQYCGHKFKVEDLTLDHVMPKSKGGGMTWENIALACMTCNYKKDNRTPEQAGMRLIRKPFRPKPGDLRINPMDKLMRKVGDKPLRTWEQFLGKTISDMYWNVTLKD